MNGQSSSLYSQNECDEYWDEATTKDTYQAYIEFLSRCDGMDNYKIAKAKLRNIENFCESKWRLYEGTGNLKHLHRFVEECKGFDSGKMSVAMALIQKNEGNSLIPRWTTAPKLEMSLLWSIFFLFIIGFILRRELKKDNVENY